MEAIPTDPNQKPKSEMKKKRRKLEEKKTDFCSRHFKKITINKLKKKKPDLPRSNLKQNKFSK